MKSHFIQAIRNLKDMLANLAAKVEHTVHLAVEAVINHQVDIAEQIINQDNEIDREEIAIEEECLKILALYQPVAGDLRQVITILKINNEIERVADMAVNIAERVPDLAQFAENQVDKFDFSIMVAKACDMLKKSLDSLAYHDVVTAAEVIRLDDAVDDIHRDNYDVAREQILRHPAQAGYYLDCLTVSHCLERIADIATNIAEDIIYLESGNIVRHSREGNNHAR
ncbi:MAG TPA: phosphate signaling complex protein PhoU [Lentisphaeria bacterium]|nr:phosphate signaling complex protein PhoU [Lentisphaeria bacterium]